MLSSTTPPQPPRSEAFLPERRRVPAAARSPYFTAVRDTWKQARAAYDRGYPAFVTAIALYARDGRARGVPIETLLRALDTVVRPEQGGDAGLDFSGARQSAGTLLIRSYYGGV